MRVTIATKTQSNNDISCGPSRMVSPFIVIMARTIISKPRSAARSAGSTCAVRMLLGTRLRRTKYLLSAPEAAANTEEMLKQGQ